MFRATNACTFASNRSPTFNTISVETYGHGSSITQVPYVAITLFHGSVPSVARRSNRRGSFKVHVSSVAKFKVNRNNSGFRTSNVETLILLKPWLARKRRFTRQSFASIAEKVMVKPKK